MSAAPVKTMPSSPDEIPVCFPVESPFSAMPPSMPSNSDEIITSECFDESIFSEPCVPVFWDVVDFPFPSGLDPDVFYRNINSFLQSSGCCPYKVLIRAYVDKENMRDEWLHDDYKKAGITILPQQGNEYERGRVMLLDIALWAYTNDPFGTEPVALIVVSKNIEKQYVFGHMLKNMASNYYSVFATLDHDVESPELHYQGFSWPSTLLSNAVKPVDKIGTGQPYSHKGSSTEETVCFPGESPFSAIPPSMPSNPDEVIMSDCPAEYFSSSEPCTPIFWDLVDFPFPSGLDPDLTYPNMKSVLESMGCRGNVLITAYVDRRTFRRKRMLMYSLRNCGIKFRRVRGDDYVRVHRMLVDIALWAMNHPATYVEPLSLMVISKNIKKETDFLKALEALEDRYYNVLVALPQPLSSSELHTVSFEWLSTNLLDGVKPVDLSGTLRGLKHKPKSREETVGFCDGLASLCPQDFSMSPVNVFWDSQDCPPDFSIIVPVLREKGYNGYLFNRPLVDPITSVVTKGDEYAKETRMLLDIIFWAMNNDGVPQNLMLISKRFTSLGCVIYALERKGVNVIFPPVASIDQQTIDSFESLCKSLSDGEKVINQRQGRKIKVESDALECEPIIVLWLTEDCAPPSNPREIWANVRRTLFDKGYGRPLLMTAYIDKQNYSDEISDVYQDSGMAVKLVPEDAKVTAMSLDLIYWSSDQRGLNFLVISKPFKDTMCDRVVEFLNHEGHSVLFELPDHMVTFGTSLWSAKSLLGGSSSAPIGSSSQPLK